MDVTNGSPNSQSVVVGFHWLAFTTRLSLEEVLEGVSQNFAGCSFGSFFRFQDHGARGYRKSAVGPHGIQVCYSDERADKHVILPGSACETVDTAVLLRLFRDPSLVNFTRVDLAIDHVKGPGGKDLSPRWLFRELTKHSNRVATRAQLSNRESVRLVQNQDFATCYLGVRSSERMLRAYNAHGFCRIEVEFKGEKAASLGRVFEKREAAEVPALAIGLLRDYVEFCVSSDSKALDRRLLQPWWAALVKGVDAMRTARARPEIQLDRTYKHLETQYAPMFATLLDWSGGDVEIFAALALKGKTRQTDRHKHLVRQAGGFGSWGNVKHESQAPADVGVWIDAVCPSIRQRADEVGGVGPVGRAADSALKRALADSCIWSGDDGASERYFGGSIGSDGPEPAPF